MTEAKETHAGKELVKVLSSRIGNAIQPNIGIIDRKKKSVHVFDKGVDEEQKEKEKCFIREVDRLWELSSEIHVLNSLLRKPGQPRIILVKSKNEDLQQPVKLSFENVDNQLFLNTTGDSVDNVKIPTENLEKSKQTNGDGSHAVDAKNGKKTRKKKSKENTEEIVDMDHETFELAAVFKDKPNFLYTGSSSRVRLTPLPMKQKMRPTNNSRQQNIRGKKHQEYNLKDTTCSSSTVINMANVQPTGENNFQKIKPSTHVHNKSGSEEETMSLNVPKIESLETDEMLVESEMSKITSTVIESQTKVQSLNAEKERNKKDSTIELNSANEDVKDLTISNLKAQTKVQTFEPEKEVITKGQTTEVESPHQDFQEVELSINNLKAHEIASDMPETNDKKKFKPINIVNFIDGKMSKIRSGVRTFKGS